MGRMWLVFVVSGDGGYYDGKLHATDDRRHGPRRVVADTAEEARDKALGRFPPSSRRAHTAIAVETVGALHRWPIHVKSPEWGSEEIIG